MGQTKILILMSWNLLLLTKFLREICWRRSNSRLIAGGGPSYIYMFINQQKNIYTSSELTVSEQTLPAGLHFSR